ncbi:MAG: ABC transporter permease [Cyclobacteriaceae bacterium]
MKTTTPSVFQRFFEWFCKNELYEELQGDLEESFEENKVKYNESKARWIYRKEVIKMVRPSVVGFGQNSKFNHIIMFRNYYVTAVRNLLKHKGYFAINISGLAIGIASFTFIASYIINELSFDNFHSKHSNIYRIRNEAVIRGQANNEATTSAPLAKLLVERYPEVLKATRIKRMGSKLVGVGEKKISEEGILYADDQLFEVFDFKLLKGNPATALRDPRSIILTESYAEKYFGYNDPMGELVTIEEDTIFYKVTGIIEDAPANSHIQFDMLASLSSTPYESSTRWVGTSLHTYAVLVDGASAYELMEKSHELFYEFMAKEIEYYTGLAIAEWEGAGNSVRFRFEPLTDIHLKSTANDQLEAGGNITYIYIYGLIGLVILSIAIFNFVNLATAHSATRAKEVGVRKVIGSTKRGLIYQFIFESVLVSVIAAILSAIAMVMLTPSFHELVGRELAVDLTSTHVGPLALIILALAVGIIAGCYPAFILSAFKPADVLKGKLKTGFRSGWFRNLLVTLQFTASIVIIIGTVVIYNQIDFMLSKNLGFDKDQTLVIKRPDWLNNSLEVFKEDLRQNPNVSVVSNSETIPGKGYEIRSYRKKDDPTTFLFQNNQVSYDHLELMGLELVSGRFFSKEYGLDSNAVVLNQSAVKTLGYQDPIGKTLSSAFKKDRPLTIIGVVKDYNVESLHKTVTPLSLELDPTAKGYVTVKLSNSKNIRETVQFVEETWQKHAKDKPFQYFFFDEDYQKLYKSETNTGQVLLVFATLSVFIACLGLIGLISYTAAIRKKEIGIRKVLGASVGSMVRLLSSEVVRLIVIATLISWPLAYFATEFWLQDFANRIVVSPWIYSFSTLALVAVVALAISFQTLKASMGNPVDSLRQE